jgi:hypothetical protein
LACIFQNRPVWSIKRMKCPHCATEIPPTPTKWAFAMPWQCSHCAGLYGTDKQGPFAINEDVRPLSPLLGYDVARRWLFYCGRKNYYTYALAYGSGLAFYIGSGNYERALSHLSETQRLRKTPEKRTAKHETIEFIWEHNEEVWFHFLGLFRTREEATVLENYYISLLGRRSTGGILTNISGEQKVDCDFPLSHIGFPEEHEIINHPDAIGKHKQSVRVFHHSDIIVPPPTSGAIVTGAVMSCPACGVKGQYMRAMEDKKLLCSNCAHYFIDGQPEDGKRRMYGDYNTLKRY